MMGPERLIPRELVASSAERPANGLDRAVLAGVLLLGLSIERAGERGAPVAVSVDGRKREPAEPDSGRRFKRSRSLEETCGTACL